MTVATEARGDAPAEAGARRRDGALRQWGAVVAVAASRAYLAFIATLAVAALAPALWQWDGYVVRSGSMEPSISVGDIVVSRPMESAEEVTNGRVFVFADPAVTDREHLLVHRVVDRRSGGRWVTAGDANADVDVTPVPRDAFRGRALLLAPYVGLPLTWSRTGDLVPLAGWVTVTSAALVVVLRSRRRRLDRSGSGAGRARRVSVAAPALALAAVVVVAPGVDEASSAFTASTGNGSSTWAVNTRSVLRYTSEVLTDAPYAYYQLDEASGTSADDASGNGRRGTLSGIAGYRSAGALPNNPGYSMQLGGTGRLVSGGSAVTNPEAFTLELWFRTSARTAGKLIGFESTQGAGSGFFDRQVTIRSDGRLVYGDWDAPQVRTVVTPSAYNDGAWHHLALVATPQGQQQDVVLLVDGQPATWGTTSRTSFYAGWWRVGHGSVRTATGGTTSAGFNGLVDQVAIYRTALSSTRIRAHYAAR